MIKYQAMYGRIKEVEIERETPAFVVFANGRKDKKITGWRSYFDTEQEAIHFLVSKALGKITAADNDLCKAVERLDAAKEDLAALCEKYGVEIKK